MTQTRLGTVVPILILLLSTISCGPFLKPVKPTQVVDLAPMVGKSLAEMTTLLGEPKPAGDCYVWALAEGRLYVCYLDYSNRSMKGIQYSFPPAPLFAPRMAVSSPEEMAAVVNIDIKGRRPDSEFQGGYAYDDLILNGKAVDVAFDGGPKTIVGVRVHLK